MAAKRAAKRRKSSKAGTKAPISDLIGELRAPFNTGSGFQLLVRAASGEIYQISGAELARYRRRDIEIDPAAVQRLDETMGQMVGLKNAILFRTFVIFDGAG